MNQPTVVGPDDSFRTNLPHPGNDQAMGNYTESYQYDEVGNILKLIHKTDSGNWARTYSYDAARNRLLSTDADGSYDHDAHGNMTRMPHLPAMYWDFADRLQQVDFNGGGTAYYVYDSSGQRVRKVWEKQGTQVEERVYLGLFERFRARTGTSLKLERETLHVIDDKRRVAMAETKITDVTGPIAGVSILRFQVDNHLGSSTIELDEFGEVISFEGYYPYGATSYKTATFGPAISLKRYRYAAKERDDGTGFYFHGARYYAPWLGRWICPDPAGFVETENLYQVSRNTPVTRVDRSGLQSENMSRRFVPDLPRGVVTSTIPKFVLSEGPSFSYSAQALQGQRWDAWFVKEKTEPIEGTLSGRHQWGVQTSGTRIDFTLGAHVSVKELRFLGITIIRNLQLGYALRQTSAEGRLASVENQRVAVVSATFWMKKGWYIQASSWNDMASVPFWGTPGDKGDTAGGKVTVGNLNQGKLGKLRMTEASAGFRLATGAPGSIVPSKNNPAGMYSEMSFPEIDRGDLFVSANFQKQSDSLLRIGVTAGVNSQEARYAIQTLFVHRHMGSPDLQKTSGCARWMELRLQLKF